MSKSSSNNNPAKDENKKVNSGVFSGKNVNAAIIEV